MTTLFQIITLPLIAVWEGIKGIIVDSGVDMGGFILAGVAMAILIGAIMHISISGSRTKGLLNKHE